jgi:hypothetical protein
VIKSQRKGGPGLLLPSTGTASLPPRERRGVGERSLFRRAILRHALVKGVAFRSYGGTSASNGPGGGTEAVNLGSTPQIGGAFLFWGAENLSLMTLIVPTPITINLGTEKSTEKRMARAASRRSHK